MGGITLKQAALWCGGRLSPEFEEIVFQGANFDTRRLRPGELFVALTGARNGHDFAASAMEKGAAAVLASQPLPGTIPAIYVENTETALRQLARSYRESLSLTCVGITGSVGKTTTKEMIAAVLETTFVTGKTEGNFNNGIGLPVTVLGMREDCEAAVLEMGMNHFGEISLLTSIAQPDLAVITNVGTMHIENLGSQEGILRAKLEILEGLRPGGCAVFCGDDAILGRIAKEYRAITYGLGEHNDVRAMELSEASGECCFTVQAFRKEFDLCLPVLGKHNVLNALAAVTVGLRCGVSVPAIQRALAGFINTGMRQRIYSRNGFHIIEDCYNAGPESMEAALDILRKSKGRRIAVLGGMLELGTYAPQAHFAIGQKTAESADLLFAYGRNSEDYLRGAKAAGLGQAQSFSSHEAMAQALRGEIREGDTLLIKGSRGMKMERVLELLFAERDGGNTI